METELGVASTLGNDVGMADARLRPKDRTRHAHPSPPAAARDDQSESLCSSLLRVTPIAQARTGINGEDCGIATTLQ